MGTAPEALWAINNEYRKRLSLLMGHLQMLEQLLRTQETSAHPTLLAAIRRIRAVLEDIDADHHNWRHTYYYRESAEMERRRMVDQPAAVQAALDTFAVMLRDHLPQFAGIRAAMRDLPRPPAALTRVIRGGDLWVMCLEEIDALAAFDRSMARAVRGD